jgi:hypothetical protein
MWGTLHLLRIEISIPDLLLLAVSKEGMPPWLQKTSERRPAFWPGIPRLRTFFDWEES